MRPSCGTSLGKPPEMRSATPSSKKIIPSVVIKEGTFKKTVIAPLKRPMMPLRIRARIIPTHQQHDFAGGNDRRGRCVLEESRHACRREESLVRSLKVDNQYDSNHDNARLALSQEDACQGRQESAPAFHSFYFCLLG